MRLVSHNFRNTFIWVRDSEAYPEMFEIHINDARDGVFSSKTVVQLTTAEFKALFGEVNRRFSEELGNEVPELQTD